MASLIDLHIGLPKTGTTFLQTRMWANRPLLEAQGLCYPGRARMDHFHGTKVARGLTSPSADSQAAWARVLDGLARWDRRGLVSHEFFCLLDLAQAERLVESLPADEVRVVITARDYVRQLPAMWQESLKMGTTTDFGSYVDRQLREPRPHGPWAWMSQDTPTIVRRWSQVVGHERVTVVTVPHPGSDRDLLWRRWCEAVDLDDTGFDVETARANQSLGAAQAAVLTRVVPHVQDTLVPGNARHRWLRHYLGHDVLLEQGGARIRLAEAHRHQLTARAHEAVDQLRALDVSVVGSLEELLPPPDDGSGTNPDSVSLEEQLDVAGRALERMVRDVQRLTLERDRLARRLRTPRRRLGWQRALDAVRRRAREGVARSRSQSPR